MSVAGTYAVEVKTPVGVQEGSLTLRVVNGALEGSLSNAQGATEFAGGSVGDNEVSFATRIRTPMGKLKAQVTGTVDGDTFTGRARLPLGTAEIHGTRTDG